MDDIKIKDSKAVILSEKSTNLIMLRKKSEIILNEVSKEHTNTPILFGNDKICGIIELNDPQAIEDYQFKNRYKRHKITEKERDNSWGSKDKLFAYSFKIKKVFKEPIAFIKTKDMGFIKNIEVKELVKKESKINKYEEIFKSFKDMKVSDEDKILKDCFVEVYRLYIEKINKRGK